ncbi:M55 family metallopeptidase [Actinoplanes sp. RD1]|uniref:M55 family metallopeptidase n=1 Tax=Actinoplanes sp. RD1 TaxID=3064538 RepID=UPI0027427059|nr:M55 family metallopeptidase [Actinoplanes sp. RD1]
MRVLISADLEGISGVVHQSEIQPGRYDYERGRALMTAEVNAVVAGVLDADPAAEVLVTDAHGSFRNILPEDLDRRALLVRGKPRPHGMLDGLDEATDAVLFVGFHARAGAGPAVLAHTMSGDILEVRVNGRPYGEIGLNAATAGHFGAPVVLLSGDDQACAELRSLVPGAVTVAVKQAIGQTAAITRHPAAVREELRRAAAEAVTHRAEIAPFAIPGPVHVEVDVGSPLAVDLATLVPGVTRTGGGRTISCTAADVAEAYRVVLLVVHLAGIKPS